MALLRGRNGDISGVLDNSGGTFNAKIAQWRLVGGAEIHNVSGFGDGGNSSYDEGIHDWRGAAQGWAQGGVATKLGLANLQGTQSCSGTALLTADNGVTYSAATIHVYNVNMGVAYSGGPIPVSFQFTVTGGLTATET